MPALTRSRPSTTNGFTNPSRLRAVGRITFWNTSQEARHCLLRTLKTTRRHLNYLIHPDLPDVCFWHTVHSPCTPHARFTKVRCHRPPESLWRTRRALLAMLFCLSRVCGTGPCGSCWMRIELHPGTHMSRYSTVPVIRGVTFAWQIIRLHAPWSLLW